MHLQDLGWVGRVGFVVIMGAWTSLLHILTHAEPFLVLWLGGGGGGDGGRRKGIIGGGSVDGGRGWETFTHWKAASLNNKQVSFIKTASCTHWVSLTLIIGDSTHYEWVFLTGVSQKKKKKNVQEFTVIDIYIYMPIAPWENTSLSSDHPEPFLSLSLVTSFFGPDSVPRFLWVLGLF